MIKYSKHWISGYPIYIYIYMFYLEDNPKEMPRPAFQPRNVLEASWDATVALQLGLVREITGPPGACNLGCSVGDNTMLSLKDVQAEERDIALARKSLLKAWICLQNPQIHTS